MKVATTTNTLPSRPAAANPPPSKSDIHKNLRKAAGSKDPAALPAFLQSHPSLTLSDVDETHGEGRTVLHMACGRGVISNVSLLLDMGCNINTIATRSHNYGKSPIFFAATRSREEVMNLLLDRGANVLIVNNKGQSVYTLARSHFEPELVKRIKKLEREQQSRLEGEDELKGWVDYRKTHSDGNVYGDLDLRFLDRPLTESDVVEDGVVNPTTKEMRKGNFARNNPNAVWKKKQDEDSKARKNKPSVRVTLTKEEQMQLGKYWDQVQSALSVKDSWGIFSSLLALVEFMEGKKIQSSWVSESASRLDFLIRLRQTLRELDLAEASPHDLRSVLPKAIMFCGCGNRHATLVRRILTKAAKVPISTNSPETRAAQNMQLTEQEKIQLDAFWNNAEVALKSDDAKSTFISLIKVVTLCDGKNYLWLNESTTRLHAMLGTNSILDDEIGKEVLGHCDKTNNRHASLLKKMLTKSVEDKSENIQGASQSSKNANIETEPCKKRKKKKSTIPDYYHSVIKHLQSSLLEDSISWKVLMNSYPEANGQLKYLSLPCPPTWVDSPDDLQRLRTKLYDAINEPNSKLASGMSLDKFLAFDSEFRSEGGNTELATIQFSILEDGLPLAWVVDLNPSPADTVYSTMICDTLRWIFVESGAHILGFAHGHDLHMISSYIGEEIPMAPNFLDLQLLAMYNMAEDSGASRNISSLPGLKSCCSYFLDMASWSLSKKEQCSNWAQRPLTANQLEYAGLDAAVLLVLLAEILRR